MQLLSTVPAELFKTPEWIKWRMSFRTVVCCFLLGIVMCITTTQMLHVVNNFIPLHAQVFQLQLMHFVFITVCFAPFVEEFIFRGCLQTAFNRMLTPSYAFILSAWLFAIAHYHISIMSAVNAFLLGLVFASMRHITKNIWPCVIMHAAHNLTVLFWT